MFLYSLHLQFYVHIQFFSPPKTYFSARIYCFFSICWAFVFHLLSLAKITICLVLFYIFVFVYHLFFSYFAIENMFNSQKTNFHAKYGRFVGNVEMIFRIVLKWIHLNKPLAKIDEWMLNDMYMHSAHQILDSS